MATEMKERREEFEISLVDIRPQCMHTQLASYRVLEDLQKGSLRAYLKCLTRIIEKQSCSSTMYDVRFSWRLPRGMYLSEEVKSLIYPMKDKGRIQVIQLPMEILDDLNICEQRALLRAKSHMGEKPTFLKKSIKRWWIKKRYKYRKLTRTIMRELGFIHDIWTEHSLSITYVGRHFVFEFNGMSDIVAFISIRCTKREFFVPSLILFEYTIYERMEDIIERIIMYASALYNKYGFQVIPVIVVIRDLKNDLVGRMVILQNRNFLGTTKSLLVKIKRLENLLSGNARPRLALEMCTQCDSDFRDMCMRCKVQ